MAKKLTDLSGKLSYKKVKNTEFDNVVTDVKRVGKVAKSVASDVGGAISIGAGELKDKIVGGVKKIKRGITNRFKEDREFNKKTLGALRKSREYNKNKDKK